jgi:hypothetical protein
MESNGNSKRSEPTFKIRAHRTFNLNSISHGNPGVMEAGKLVGDLDLPYDGVLTPIIRGGELIVPRGPRCYYRTIWAKTTQTSIIPGRYVLKQHSGSK